MSSDRIRLVCPVAIVALASGCPTLEGDDHGGDFPTCGTWTKLSPTGTAPSARSGHSAIYDSAGKRMIIFGGESAASLNGDAWALSLGDRPEWILLAPSGTGPEPRRGHTAIYDGPRNRMIVFGGADPSPRDDVWILSLTGTPTWSEMAVPDPKPSARYTHSTVYDGAQQLMVVFAGYGIDRGASSYLNDLWALSLSTDKPVWTRWSVPGSNPGARAKQTAIYDSASAQFVTYGGTDAEGSKLGDPRLLPLPLTAETRWIETTTPYTSMVGGAAVYDPRERRMIAYGGSDYYGTLFQTLMIMLLPARGEADWKFVVAKGQPSAGRSAHTAVYAEDKVIVFGGLDQGSKPLGDVWSLSLPRCP